MNSVLRGDLLLDPKVIQDPYPFYHALHEHAPVWTVPGGEVVIVSSYALIKEAVARVEDFSSNLLCLLYRDDNGAPGRIVFGGAKGGQTLATADPPVHTLHKRTVFPAFVAKRMARLEPQVEEIAAACIDRAIESPTAEFMTAVANHIPVSVISRLVGFRNVEPDRLLDIGFEKTALSNSLSRTRLLGLLERRVDGAAWITDQLALAAEEPGEDVLTSISDGIRAGALKAHEGVSILQTLLAAGTESTSNLIGNAVRLLAERPELQERMRRSPELIPSFLEEVLRLESPFRGHMRSVPADTVLGGVSIRAGATVVLMWGAGNRDPAAFDAPDDLVLNRPRQHLGFGRGIHMCIGAPLARLEARVALTLLLARTAGIALDPEQPARWVDSFHVRRHERLPLQLIPR
jgi:cytochrome P450